VVVIILIPASSAASAPTATAAARSATAASASAPDAIAQQVAFHVAQRFQLLDRRIGLLLLVLDRAHPLGDLNLHDGGQAASPPAIRDCS
jgi:hypothetical protein